MTWHIGNTKRPKWHLGNGAVSPDVQFDENDGDVIIIPRKKRMTGGKKSDGYRQKEFGKIAHRCARHNAKRLCNQIVSGKIEEFHEKDALSIGAETEQNWRGT